METQNLKGVLNSAGMRHGGPSVMDSGPPLMLMWLADSLDLFHQVDIICHTGAVHSKLARPSLSLAGAIARYNAFFGQGTGPSWLDDLLCRGNEQRIIDCPVSTGGIGMVDFCNGHADDAGVTCQIRML